MGILERLFTRFHRTGALFLIGFFLVLYIAVGFLYIQQGPKQREFEEKTARLSGIVAKPLPSADELRAEFDNVTMALAFIEVNQVLVPITDTSAIEMLVSIAEKNGIDVDPDPDSGKFLISPASAAVREEKRGGISYQVLSFRNISVQGDHESVMAFISDLDSGNTLETMVLRKVAINQVEVKGEGEEGVRRTEYQDVLSAVIAMMTADNLTEIPNPISYIDGTATNLMGDDPDTEEAVEGFPDIITTAVDRGYTGADTPRNGYVLYEHDRIGPTDNATFTTDNYTTMLRTEYYYTCEADGTVRQFGGPDLATATWYLDTEESWTETVAIVDIDIYTRPPEGD